MIIETGCKTEVQVTQIVPPSAESQSGGHRGGSSVLLFVAGNSAEGFSVELWAKQFSLEFDAFVLSSELPVESRVKEFVDCLAAELQNLRIRRLTVVGAGSGSAVVQALAVHYPKLVRRLVLINARSRIAPGVFQRFLDKFERLLPLGLPLRPLSQAYDSRPVLHRIHCPVLVLTSSDASSYEIEQSRFIAKRIPNCWSADLAAARMGSEQDLGEELHELIVQFMQVPVKCPQKNTSSKSGAERIKSNDGRRGSADSKLQEAGNS